MSSSSTWTLCVCLLPCLLNCSVSEAKDVLLQCRDHRGGDIELVNWIRPDLVSEGSVFFFRDKQTDGEYQHPSFHGRVELRDPQMKDGDVSVILNNFNVKDTGTYECYVRIKGSGPKLINTVHLIDVNSGCGAQEILEETYDKLFRPDVFDLVLYVLQFVCLLGIVVRSFIIYKKYKRLKKQIYQLSADKKTDHELLVLTPEPKEKVKQEEEEEEETPVET